MVAPYFLHTNHAISTHSWDIVNELQGRPVMFKGPVVVVAAGLQDASPRASRLRRRHPYRQRIGGRARSGQALHGTDPSLRLLQVGSSARTVGGYSCLRGGMCFFAGLLILLFVKAAVVAAVAAAAAAGTF